MENIKILNFSFNKIFIEKYKEDYKNLEIKNKLNIISISSIKDSPLKIKEDILNIQFDYLLDYEPNIAKLEIKGNLLLALDQKDYKNVLKDWENNKKIEDNFKIFLFNLILKKTNLKALTLEETLNIPLHLPFPLVKEAKSK